MSSRRPRFAAAALAISVTALLALGCGGDDSSETVTVTEEPATTAPSTEGTTGDGEAPGATREVDELTGFASPTGNIGCYIEPAQVRCDIAERDWEPPKPPKSCELDYGQGVELIAGGEAKLVCAGDTALNEDSVLAYGESIAAGLLRCESSEAAMTCRDIETGRGFSLARERYEIF
jgi:hypothetical protein